LFESKGIDIFKQNASVAQLLRQGEIDALGLCENGDGRRIVAIDVAFHEAGLNYGGKQETAARVAKKVLRTVLVVETFFPNHSAEIIFAAPKINDAQFTAINNAMELLDTFLEVEEVSAECRVVANADFFGEIVTPVTDLAGAVADTSELFMRSVQLLAMAPNSERATRSPLSASDASATKQFASDLSSDGEVELEKTPIGKVVQREFERKLLGNLLSDDEIAALCTKEYSKETFGLRYPALVKSTSSSDRFDDKGNARYYSSLIAGNYLLCNDWYARNRQRFENWLRRVGR
jgi:hypothetical protein